MRPCPRRRPPRLPDLSATRLTGQRPAPVTRARRLTRPAGRAEAGRFLVEGPHAVREALAAGAVEELFATPDALQRHPDLAAAVTYEVDERTLASLCDAVTPQGVVAVAPLVDVPLADALGGSPRRVAVLVDPSDPGNTGTVIRVADAAGCDAVVLAGGVDPHNAKCVRATVGSLWHLPVARTTADALLPALRAAGLRVVATTGSAQADLWSADLSGPVALLFGSEAHGLDDAVLDAAAAHVRIPMLGRAESLNLATAAAICLFEAAKAQQPAPGLAD